jgi:hypothetical protein
VSGVRKAKKTKTCWSEAEIPSEAKQQRGTLKPYSLGFVICNFHQLPPLHIKNEDELNPQFLNSSIPQSQIRNPLSAQA